jgi:hypothetical protein
VKQPDYNNAICQTVGVILRVTSEQVSNRAIFLKEAVMSMFNSENPTIHDNGQHEWASDRETNGDAKVLRSLRESARLTTDALFGAGCKASVAVKEFGDGAYQAGSRAGARVAGQVKAQPVTAALVAASIGLLIGVLLPRR